jgi:hypothetical protein
MAVVDTMVAAALAAASTVAVVGASTVVEAAASTAAAVTGNFHARNRNGSFFGTGRFILCLPFTHATLRLAKLRGRGHPTGRC